MYDPARAWAHQIRVNVPQKTRRLVFEQDGYRCTYCLKVFTAPELDADHVIPISWTMVCENRPEMLITACRPCNQTRRDKTAGEHRFERMMRLYRCTEDNYEMRDPVWTEWR